MRVIGIDPGIATTGYGIVERDVGGCRALSVGVVRTTGDRAHEQRLLELNRSLCELMDRWKPDAAAVERLFFNANVRTAMAVGQASGVALSAAAQLKVPVTTYTPTEVKSSVVGAGAASKKQVGAMVARLLGLAVAPTPPDAADACALALCHLARAGLRRAIAGAGA
jgi:crossover junction endodeoxyribonuclease RuvC